MGMLASVLGRLNFQVKDGKLVSVNRKLTDTQRRLRAASRETYKLKRSFSQMFYSMNNIMQGYLIYKVGSMITGMGRDADKAAKQAQSAGMASAEQYQSLDYVTQRAGASVEVMAKGMQRLARNMDAAKRGSKAQADAFGELGIEIETSDGKLRSTYDIFLEMTDAFDDGATKAQKVAWAQILMGRSGSDLMPLLNQTSAQIKEQAKRAKDLGYVMSNQTAAAGERYQDALLDLKVAMTGLRNSIAKDLLPAISDQLEAFSAWYREGDNAQRMLKYVKMAAKAAGVVIAAMVTSKVIAMVGLLRKSVFHLARTILLLGPAGVAAKATLAVWLLAFGVIVDFIQFARGNKSITGEVLDKESADEFRQTLREIGTIFGTIWDTLRPMIPTIGSIAKGFAHVLAWVVKITAWVIKTAFAIGMGIGEAIDGAIKLVIDLAKWISKTAGYITGGLVAGWQAFYNAVKTGVLKLVDIVTWPFRKIIQAYQYVANKLGIGGKKLSLDVSGLTKTARGAATLQRQQIQQSLKVDSVAVKVEGSTNMGSEELAKSVRKGVGEALQGMITQSFADLSEVAS